MIRGSLVDLDPHVVDHADDVFDLIGIGNIRRQVIIDFRVRQEALLFAFIDQLFEAGLLLCQICAHITSDRYQNLQVWTHDLGWNHEYRCRIASKLSSFELIQRRGPNASGPNKGCSRAAFRLFPSRTICFVLKNSCHCAELLPNTRIQLVSLVSPVTGLRLPVGLAFSCGPSSLSARTSHLNWGRSDRTRSPIENRLEIAFDALS